MEVPFHLVYSLSRGQRLVPHLRVWGPVPVLAVLFVAAQVGMLIRYPTVRNGLIWGGADLLLLMGFRGFFVGLIDAVLVRTRSVDIIFDQDAGHILLGDQRWCIFLDTIRSIERYRQDVWTIEHANGTVLNIPAAVVGEEQIAFIRAAMERGRTPEGIRGVIERGRKIEQLRRLRRERGQ